MVRWKPPYPPPAGEKWCYGCRDHHAVDRFSRSSRWPDGRQKACKKCHARFLQNRRAAMRAAGRASYSQRYHRKLRDEVMRHYCGGTDPACECCGEDTFEFLSIDHIHGGGRKHREQIGCRKAMYGWLKRNGYPDGFRVLCHNCNQALGNWGYCPHNRPPA